jgi:hypothetical protein
MSSTTRPLMNRLGEEFGMERLSATVLRGSSLSAEDLTTNICNAGADFCDDDFNDDVTILVVKCNFDGSSTVSSQNIPRVGHFKSWRDLGWHRHLPSRLVLPLSQVALHPERHVVSALTIIQCAGLFVLRLLRLISVRSS